MNKQLTYEQITDVLKTIDAYHDKVKHICNTTSVGVSEKQQNLLIEKLREDQQEIQSAQQYYREHASGKNGIKPWVQYVPLQELEASMKEIERNAEAEVETFVTSIIDFHRFMYEFFQRIKEQAPSEESQSVLGELAEMEQQNAKSIAKRLAGLHDI